MEDTIYFAQLDENDIVITVYSYSCKQCCDYLGNKSENIGIGICQKRYGANTVWKETFKDGRRGNFAGIGYTYMSDVQTLGVGSTDIFISQKPYPSWSLDLNQPIWKAPLEKPSLTDEEQNAGSSYLWDEDVYQADNTSGWIFINHDK